MNDPTRLRDAGSPLERRLLDSARDDRPDPKAAHQALLALGLVAAPTAVAAAAAAPAVTAAVQGGVFGSLTAKLALGAALLATAGATTVVLVERTARPPAADVAPAPARAPVPVLPPPSTLAQEHALLRDTLSALESKRLVDATEAFLRYRREHPSGELAEEAAALEVRLFEARGEHARAVDALERFHRRWPNSVLEPVINPQHLGDSLGERREAGAPEETFP